MHIHKALMDINESPVYVLLNPLINHAQKDLLVNIYESELHVIDGISQLIFVRSSYTIETVETERIYVDHVAHLKPSDLVELQPPLLYGLYNVKNIEGGNLRQPSLRSQQVPRFGLAIFLIPLPTQVISVCHFLSSLLGCRVWENSYASNPTCQQTSTHEHRPQRA